MEVTLSPEMERLIHENVESGEYSSASEMTETALSHLTATSAFSRSDLFA